MEDYLCIIRQDDSVDWYMLCVRDTMYCIACGCKRTLLRAIKLLQRRYKTPFRLNEALQNMSEKPYPSEMTRMAYQSLYETQNGKYDYLLRNTLEEAYEEVREKRKPRKLVLASKAKTKTTGVVGATKRLNLPAPKVKPSMPRKVNKLMKAKPLPVE